MNTQPSLMESAAHYRVIRQELIERHGLDEDDPALLDTLEGCTDLVDQIRGLLRHAKDIERLVQTNKDYIAELEALNESRIRKAQKWRSLAIYFMGLVGLKRLESHDFSVTLVDGKPRLCGSGDPDSLPDRFVRIKRAENRKAIFDALRNGEQLEGYWISNGAPHLRTNA